ncbi:MAG TPA: diacylglucosamine hydrolase [Porphyromonadaceae bacterium]|nr:diacylglucosamine hydrolase [Porphyromonadaceae bacterium]
MKGKEIKLEIPFPTHQVLLHSCCAPCSSAIVEFLLNQEITPTLYYCNPNIFPREEYEHRREECFRFARLWNIPMVEEEYNHEEWLYDVAGLEQEPERGKRCLQCFKMRLLHSFRYASLHNFRVVTTTLSSSRWKDFAQIQEAGHFAQQHYPNVLFWEYNWKKGGLSERRNFLLKRYAFYNQFYCGCEFSFREKKGV